jgi:hypothetical protein
MSPSPSRDVVINYLKIHGRATHAELCALLSRERGINHGSSIDVLHRLARSGVIRIERTHSSCFDRMIVRRYVLVDTT